MTDNNQLGARWHNFVSFIGDLSKKYNAELPDHVRAKLDDGIDNLMTDLRLLASMYVPLSTIEALVVDQTGIDPVLIAEDELSRLKLYGRYFYSEAGGRV